MSVMRPSAAVVPQAQARAASASVGKGCLPDAPLAYARRDGIVPPWGLANLKELTMADDKTSTGGQDRARINVNEDYEVRDWAKKFGVTADELRDAVAVAGTWADDVEAQLNASRH